jgi:EpsI family protein
VSFRESHFARYQLGGESVDLFLGIGYRAQRFTSLLSPKTEVPGTGWIVEERGRGKPGSSDREVDVLVARSATRRLLVYHWLDGSSGLAPEALRSLLALDATPWRQSRDPLVVRIATEIDGPGAEELRQAEARLERFMLSLRPGLERLILDMDAYAADSGRKGFP